MLVSQFDHFGSLKNWIHESSNKKYWNQLVDHLTHPEIPFSERPEEWVPLSSWQAQHANPAHKNEHNNSDDNNEHNNDQDSTENGEPIPPQ